MDCQSHALIFKYMLHLDDMLNFNHHVKEKIDEGDKEIGT